MYKSNKGIIRIRALPRGLGWHCACIPHMKTLIVLILAGWFVAVTFFGPEIFNAINGPKPAAVKRVR